MIGCRTLLVHATNIVFGKRSFPKTVQLWAVAVERMTYGIRPFSKSTEESNEKNQQNASSFEQQPKGQTSFTKTRSSIDNGLGQRKEQSCPLLENLSV